MVNNISLTNQLLYFRDRFDNNFLVDAY